MTDVRLTATNPEDSSVVPVACNERGELLLEEPTLASDDYVAVTGDNMTGNLTLGDDNIVLNATDGSANFAGHLQVDPSSGLAISVNTNRFAVASDGSFTAAREDASVRMHQSAYQVAGGAVPLAIYDIEGDSKKPTSYIKADGSATFDGPLTTQDITFAAAYGYSNIVTDATGFYSPDNWFFGPEVSSREVRISMYATDGSANFDGDVVVGSRNKQWMLVEQNGLCHMVEQIRANTADLVDPSPVAAEYPPLRDVFAELDAVEKALGDVMEKLRMNPPAGWEVWDGSSENS